MSTITTRTAEISYNTISRVLTIRLLEGAELELADALQNHEATKMLTNTDHYLALVDGRVKHLSVSRDARAFAAQSKKEDGCIATALLITSTANKLIGNFYININRPNIPTKIFSTEDKAIEWLQESLYLTESKRPVLSNNY